MDNRYLLYILIGLFPGSFCLYGGTGPLKQDQGLVPELVSCRAVIVGVNSYRAGKPQLLASARFVDYQRERPNITQLNGAVRDALAFEALLLAIGVKPERITTLISPAKAEQGSFRQAATLENVVNALQSARCAVAANEWLVFYFSGHGVVGMDPRDERVKPYLLLADSDPANLATTGLAFEELEDRQQSRTRYHFTILDACNSGRLAVDRGVYSFNDETLKRQASSEGNYDILVSAARDYQASLEDNNGGYFSQALVRGMLGFGDLRKEEITVSLYDAYTYAYNETSRRSNFTQTPYISGGKLALKVSKYPDTCGNLFEHKADATHWANRDLIVEVTLRDPSIVFAWSSFQESILGLRLRWRLDRSSTHNLNMNYLGDGRFQVTIPGRLLDAGRLVYWFEFQQGIFGDRFPVMTDLCQYETKIRR